MRLAGLGVVSTLLSGCGLSPTATPEPFVAPRPSRPPTAPAATPSPTAAQAMASPEPPAPAEPAADAAQPPTPVPDLDFMLGQMLLVGFRGLAVDAQHPIVADIRERHLGGVVLFDFDGPTRSTVRNVESRGQVQALTASLQAAAAAPLLIAIDQEGGRVARLSPSNGFPASLSHQRLGELADPAITAGTASAMARLLVQVGINLNLAPVVDLNTNPRNPVIARYERSFGADAELVTRMAAAFIDAHRQAGVLCCLKHFPGHGSSTADSHFGLVDVSDTWTRQELQPYAELIRAGLADSVMTAHVFNARLDPDSPATLSAAAISGLLRGELGYDGVVISDDMQMGAIRRHYGFEEAVLAAVDAGVDILAIANNSVFEEEVVSRTVEILRRAVEQGRISHARIEQSYARIRRLKERLAVAAGR